MKKSFLKDWDLSPMALAYALLGFRPPVQGDSGKYWRKLEKPTKEQQAATISACEVKQYRKASKRLDCYSYGIKCQPIKHKYFRERYSELMPF